MTIFTKEIKDSKNSLYNGINAPYISFNAEILNVRNILHN